MNLEQNKIQRRTIIVYNSPTPDLSSGNSDQLREKLASQKNLMYSTREAEIIEDITSFLINKNPGYVF